MAKKQEGGESIQGYFRQILNENPKLLKQRSNEELYRRWLADHPDEKEVPERVKQGLANLKSLLRKRSRRMKKVRVQSNGHEATAPVALTVTKAPPRPSSANLFKLEAQIDEALLTARSMDPTGLDDVIKLLRSARNKVIVRLAGD
ncbi:MAG: hypothetical protein N2039_14100 [Gemmataceae bacterium]|nr:hypothetical protein [Gemmataceae bacterium]